MLKSPFVHLATTIVILTTPPLDAAVHVVDDNGGVGVGFTDIQPAVTAAQDGDMVLVKTGVYGGFTITDKALVVTADSGQTVTVTGQILVQNLSAGKQLAISGVDVQGNQTGEALILQQNAGPILIENGTFVGDGIMVFQTPHAAKVTSTTNVTFVDCILSVGFGSGGVAALQATSSSVHMYGCSMFGGDQTLETFAGGDGCQITSGFLFASDCTFVGGQGGPGVPQDIFQPCTNGGPGGNGLHHPFGSPTSKILDCTFTGGPGGVATDVACATGPTGLAQKITTGSVSTFTVPARTYDISSPVREGTIGSLSLAGDPGEFAWIFFSIFQSPSYADTIKGTLLPGTPHIVIFFGALPAGGALTLNVTVPIEPSMQSFALIEQAVYWTQAKGFQVSNPRLGVVLDQSL